MTTKNSIQPGDRVRWHDYPGTVLAVGEPEPSIDGLFTPVTIRRDPTVAAPGGVVCVVDASWVEVIDR